MAFAAIFEFCEEISGVWLSASIKACSSSRHIAWRKSRSVSTAKRRPNSRSGAIDLSDGATPILLDTPLDTTLLPPGTAAARGQKASACGTNEVAHALHALDDGVPGQQARSPAHADNDPPSRAQHAMHLPQRH